MASIKLIQTNFTAGEISPRTMGRVDISRYHNGAKEIENGIPVIHGGVQRRYGSVFVSEAKYHDKKIRLIPYIFNRDQSYILEFGDHYMRVYSDNEQVQKNNAPYEVYTPYSEDDLASLRYAQGADTLFIAHPDIRLFRVQRIGHDNWQCEAVPFVSEARREIGHRFSTDIGLSALSGNVVVSANLPVFLSSDVGRTVSSGASYGEVIQYLSGYQVVISTQVSFQSSFISQKDWLLEGSPVCSVKPSTKGVVGTTITLTTPENSQIVTLKRKILHYRRVYNVENATALVRIAAHGYSVGQVVSIRDCVPDGFNGNFEITSIADADNFYIKGMYQANQPTVLGSVVTYQSSTNGVAWRAQDVGKTVRVNDGVLEIISIDSPSTVTCRVKKALSSDVEAQALAWTLESNSWNEFDGFPRAVSLYEQRLILGGTYSFPNTVWFSKIGEYFNFESGTDDDEGFSFALSGDQYNPISHIAQTKTLTALTYGGESTMWGGQEKAITPTNIQVKTQSVYGCNDTQPVRIGNELFFAQRAGRKIRAMSYRYDTDSFGSPDISVMSEHITESGVIDMAYQQEPDSILWIVRNDGVLCSLTMDREQEVMAWARHITNGKYISIAVVPAKENDQVWTVVARTVNGQEKKYIERFDSSIYTDCSITLVSDESKYEWDGLDRLEGFEIDIVADDETHPRRTVVNGQITLERRANQISIGIPYLTKIRTLTPEIQGQMGSIQGAQMNIGKVRLRLLNTIGAKVNGTYVQFRKFGKGTLSKLSPFTGEYEINKLGWGNGHAEILIEHDDPLPFHLIAVIYDLTVGQ